MADNSNVFILFEELRTLLQKRQKPNPKKLKACWQSNGKLTHSFPP